MPRFSPSALAVCVACLTALPLASQTELAAPTPPTLKMPEPAAAAQKEAEKRIRELFRAEYAKRAPADLHALAKALIQEGQATTDDDVSRYVYFRESRDLATQAADAVTALAAVDHLARLYAIDADAMKAAALAAVERAVRSPETAAALAEARLVLVEEARAADRLDAAGAHAAKAETAARAARSASLLGRAMAQVKTIADARRERPLAFAAEKTLEQKPDDPAANLAAGRYACLFLDAWERGLPMLAKGLDVGLQAAAEKDLAGPSTDIARVDAGHAWWDLAEKASGRPRQALFTRALLWYAQAWPTLSALKKAPLRERARAALATPGIPIDDKAYKPPDDRPADWHFPQDGERPYARLDERFVRSGRFAAFLTAPPDDSINIYSSPVSAAPGQRFTFSAWIRTENTVAERDFLQIRFAEADNEVNDADEIYPPPDFPFWHRMQRSVACPPKTVRVVIRFRSASPGGKIWMDDVSLTREGEGIELLENGQFDQIGK